MFSSGVNLGGAGNAGSASIATLAEARAGINNTKAMSPFLVKALAKQVFYIENYGGKADSTTFANGSITNGSAILNCPSATFVTADIGKRIEVQGAGVAGARLLATITGINSNTQVTLSVAASTTVTGEFTYGTDNGIAINAALQAIYNANGGELLLGIGTWTSWTQIVNPNDGVSIQPKGKSVTITGYGNYWSSQQYQLAAQGGTVLDCRFVGATANLITFGFGTLEIRGITFANLGRNFTTPFIYTTNTRLNIHDCSFLGNYNFVNGTSSTQDCIVLGGTGTLVTADATSPFQGYGTIIAKNYFDHVRRAVIGQNYCNANVIRDNTIWYNCGGAECFRFVGDVTNSSGGNIFSGNLIEVTNYTQIWYLDRCVNFSFTDNTTFDNINSTCTSLVFNTATSQNHFWRDGGNQVPGVAIFGGSNATSNRYETSLSGGTNNISNNTNQFGTFTIKNNVGPRQQRNGTGEIWYRQTDNTDRISDYIDRTPVGGAVEGIGTYWRTGATSGRYTWSVTDIQLESTGILRLWSAAGNLLVFGDPGSGTTNYMLNNTWHSNDTVGYKLSNVTGLNWTGGAASGGVEVRLERQSARRLRITDGGSLVGSLSSTFLNPAQFTTDANADAGFVGGSAPDGTIYSLANGFTRIKTNGVWTGLPFVRSVDISPAGAFTQDYQFTSVLLGAEIPNNSSIAVDAIVTVRDTTTQNTATIRMAATFRRVAGVYSQEGATQVPVAKYGNADLTALTYNILLSGSVLPSVQVSGTYTGTIRIIYDIKITVNQ